MRLIIDNKSVERSGLTPEFGQKAHPKMTKNRADASNRGRWVALLLSTIAANTKWLRTCSIASLLNPVH